MSGFDFDALRDPDAPFPGTRERAGVDARARQLRVRRRRARLATSATSIVAIAAIGLGVVAVTHNHGPEIALPGVNTTLPTAPTTVGPSVDDRFIPPTSTQNGVVVLPVTLPDGETFTLRYPHAMRIAQLGFAGGGGVVGFSGVSSRQVTVSYSNIQRTYGDEKPLAVYPDAYQKPVPLYAGKEPTLAFQFGPWLVQVSDGNSPMTKSQLQTWARNLTGDTDANGYLVLHAQAPLRVANWFDGGFGSFDHGDSVELASHLYCGQQESDTAAHRRFTNGDGTHGVAWCDADLHVVASGTPAFVDLADTRLEVRRPRSGSTVTTSTTSTSTTTTTAPAAIGIPAAVSASFVSPSQGWVLEKNGRVDATTDGGAHWRAVGSLGVSGAQRKIRFADAARGFAFDDDAQGRGSLLATDDGGASWARLDTPFSNPYDLAISHGVVYAVALQSGTSEFRIWSAPADALNWTEHPLKIPIGAGPVPQVQLVFSGGRGWLLEVDRVVIAGARMSVAGQWAAWTPPCLSVNGPAELAAATGTDIVASCDEGVWGPPARATSVYFSHDGGTTFQRQRAPGFGPVGSPNPTTAVIATTSGVQRTTDAGATWKSALPPSNGSGASDIGFTTSTQGFVVFENGPMFMTHDAGATWQRARLP